MEAVTHLGSQLLTFSTWPECQGNPKTVPHDLASSKIILGGYRAAVCCDNRTFAHTKLEEYLNAVQDTIYKIQIGS